MTEQEIFQNNLEALLQWDPHLALELENIVPLLPTPFPEAKTWFSSLSLENVDVLYVYGISPAVYEAAQDWLREGEERYLIFLEDDLSVLAGFFHTETASALLCNPGAEALFFFDPVGKDILFDKLSWKFVMGSIAVFALPEYARHKEARLFQLQHRLGFDAAVKKALLDEYLQYGIAFFRNVYPNLLQLHKSFWGPGLFGKAKGIPAIICGAGPSLDKQLSLLSTLADGALIFAGGSSFNALLEHGILPHFGAGIDPNQEQEERIAKTAHQPIAFFYRLRMHHRAVAALRGPRLYIPGSGGYDIGEWIDQNLGIPEGEPIDEGHNVVHFCTEIARAMGCSPLIYIGMDLALTGGAEYAEGIKPSRRKQSNVLDEEQIAWKDIYGQPIGTLWKWVAEARWLGDYAEAHPDCVMINATEGGIGFEGVANLAFSEVVEAYVTKKFSLREKVEQWIAKSPLPSFSVEERTLLLRLQESLGRCEGYLEGILEEAEKIREKIVRGCFTPLDLETGRAALLETELAEEEGYAAVLDLFALILGQILQRQKMRLQRKQLSKQEEELEKLAIQVKRFTFLCDAAKLHQQLIAASLQRMDRL